MSDTPAGGTRVDMDVDENAAETELLRLSPDAENLEDADSDICSDDILLSDEDYEEDNEDDNEDDKGAKSQAAADEDPAKFDEHMRSYQLELAQRAVEGRNVIICAPTGSGKTRVALYIVRKHMQQAAAQTRKVVFMARTVPLATQQYKAFKKHLPEFETLKLCGDSDQRMELHMLLPHYHIVVLTPQVLVNHLEQKKLESLSGHFSLLLLDECHHTRKEEAYNRLMRIYLKEKIKERRKDLPQVVGLTASLGVEKATDDQEAMEAITGVMANMDVLTIATVQQNKEELKKLVPVPEEKMEQMVKRDKDPAGAKLEEVMKKLEEKLYDFDITDEEFDSLVWKKPKKRSGQAYRQWVFNLADALRRWQTDDSNSQALARDVCVLTEHLSAYNTALQINENVRLNDAFKYLEKKLSLQSPDDAATETEKELMKHFKGLRKAFLSLKDNSDAVNPNLKKLETTLAARVKEKGLDSRVIVFVSTRATCRAMVDWLREDVTDDVLTKFQAEAEAFTGSGAAGEDDGMTQAEQENVIARFRAGEVKLLVATSVAEEGLDIPDCNIVIRYDHVGNEISTIQTRGRARKKGGVSVLIGRKRSQMKERLNLARAAMMERAVNKVQSVSESELRTRVERKQKEIMDQEDIREMVRKTKADNRTEGQFTVICSKCRRHVEYSCNIVRIKDVHHVVIGQHFWKRVERGRKRKMEKFDGMMTENKMFCNYNNCRNVLGKTLQYEKVLFPALKVKRLIFVHGDTNDSYKKWTDVPYIIDDISPESFRIHLGTEEASEEASGASQSGQEGN